jgi:hypothetical protein
LNAVVGVTVNVESFPSVVFIDTLLPSTAVMVPISLCSWPGCAKVAAGASTARTRAARRRFFIGVA